MSIPPSKGPTYTRILIVVYPFTRTRSYLHPSLPRLCTRLLTSLCLIRKAEPKRFNNLEQEVPSFQILPPLSCSHISLFRKKKKEGGNEKKEKNTKQTCENVGTETLEARTTRTALHELCSPVYETCPRGFPGKKKS